MQKKSTIQSVNPLGSWRYTLVMVRKGSSQSMWKSYGTFRPYRGSNSFSWPRNSWNRWHGTKSELDTILRSLDIHPMLNHGPILMRFIVKKLVRLGMYMLRWQQMGSILMECWLPHTLVGRFLLSPSISPLASSSNNKIYSCRW
jgi:hypothetical protein